MWQSLNFLAETSAPAYYHPLSGCAIIDVTVPLSLHDLGKPLSLDVDLQRLFAPTTVVGALNTDGTLHFAYMTLSPSSVVISSTLPRSDQKAVFTSSAVLLLAFVEDTS